MATPKEVAEASSQKDERKLVMEAAAIGPAPVPENRERKSKVERSVIPEVRDFLLEDMLKEKQLYGTYSKYSGFTTEDLVFESVLFRIKNSAHGKDLILTRESLNTDKIIRLAQTLEKDTLVETLDLSSNHINDQGFRAIAEMLKVNTTLKILNLSSNYSANSLPIITALETNKNLVEVDLSYCSIPFEGPAALVKVLRTNKFLKRLNLAGTHIYSDGPRYRKEDLIYALEENNTLTHLNLKGNKPWPSICHFADALASKNTTLEVMELELPPDASYIEKEILGKALGKIEAFTSRNRNLKQKLQPQPQPEAQERNLKEDAEPKPQTKPLNIKPPEAQPKPLDIKPAEKAQPKPLVFNPPAILERKLVTEKSAIRLAPERDPDIMSADKFKKLAEDVQARFYGETLHLNDPIDDVQTINLTEILKKDTTIRSLQLPTNRIGRKGFLAIASMLQVNTTLETMDLYHNRNHSKMVGSGNILPIIHTLKYSKSCLQHIYLRECNLNDDDAMAFKEVLETNDSLLTISLSNNPIGLIGLNALVTGLRKNYALTRLYLEGNEFQVDRRKTSLVTLNSVIWPDGQNREEILEQIRKITHVNYQRRMHKISLQQEQQRQEQLQEAQAKSLKEDAELKQADDHVPEIDIQWHLDEASDSLERKLVTEESAIGLAPAPEEIKLLAEKPSVCLPPEEIKLKAEETFPKKQEEVPILFQRHPDIMHDLKFNELLNEIQNRPYLKPNEILDEMQNSPLYKTLIFDTELIDDKHVIELAEILKKDRTIDTLHLPTNKIGKQGFLAIAEMLTINTKLETISLHFNPSYPTMLDSGNILPIIKALESNQSLQSIYLDDCNLNDDDAEALKKVFEVNKKLRSLHLSNNHIGSSGGIAIAKGLESNCSLKYLFLEGNELQGAYLDFAVLVERNTTLEMLILDSSTAGRKEILELINKRIVRNISKRLRLENAQREQLRLENVRREHLKTVELLNLMKTKMHASQFLEFNVGENFEERVLQPLYPDMPLPSAPPFDNCSDTYQAVAPPASASVASSSAASSSEVFSLADATAAFASALSFSAAAPAAAYSSAASSLPDFAGDSKSASEARNAPIETFPVLAAPRYIDNDEETQMALALSLSMQDVVRPYPSKKQEPYETKASSKDPFAKPAGASATKPGFDPFDNVRKMREALPIHEVKAFICLYQEFDKTEIEANQRLELEIINFLKSPENGADPDDLNCVNTLRLLILETYNKLFPGVDKGQPVVTASLSLI